MEIASSDGFIDGIYNYCDRWCEKCVSTSKCRNYAFNPENHELSEEDTFEYLSNVFKATILMLDDMAKEMGIDLSEIDDSVIEEGSEPFQDHLTRFAKDTSDEIHDWFESVDPTTGMKIYDTLKQVGNNSTRYTYSLEVISWYLFFTTIKLERAVSSLSDEDYAEYTKNDSDGSAKVALIGLDRSIAAWAIAMEQRPEYEDIILNFLIKLARIRSVAEKRFPDARGFFRPGLDE